MYHHTQLHHRPTAEAENDLIPFHNAKLSFSNPTDSVANILHGKKPSCFCKPLVGELLTHRSRLFSGRALITPALRLRFLRLAISTNERHASLKPIIYHLSNSFGLNFAHFRTHII